ncbi:MAG: MBL fold metallo-hydrolase [Eubacteriales bacterium]|nr:MBL fold metallo-hydrolase [Eubacteriales bacterium]
MKKKVCVLFCFVALALFFAQSQVEAATLNKKKVELSVGKTATLTLKNANGTVKWTSGNSKICKVKNGKLTAVAPGKTTIKAKYKKNVYKCNVVVSKSGAKVHFIDVGQGNATLIQVNNKNVLIDTGKESEYQKLSGYFKSLNIKKIDIMIISHYDEDHMGSSERIFDDFSVDAVYTSKYAKEKDTRAYKDFMKGLDKHALSLKYLKGGDKVSLGSNACIDILGPLGESDNDNDSSVVTKFTYYNNAYLVCGDISASVENAILQKYNVSADVFLANHHGSAYSNAILFVKKVNPQYSIFSVGADNSYGHPDSTIYKRITTLTSKRVYRTDEDGTIIISSDGDNLSVKTKKTSTQDNSTTEQQTTEQPTQTLQKIIGNINSKVYHVESCGSLPYEKNRVYFNSWEEAERNGYRACGNCKGGKQ